MTAIRRAGAMLGAALLVTVGLAACSTPSSHRQPSATPTASPQAPTQAPTQAMVTWVGAVCTADSELQTQQAAAGTAALYTVGRQATRDQIAGFIAVVRQDLAGNLTQFQKIHGGAVSGGDQVVAAYVTAIKTALSGIDRAHATATDSSQPDLVVAGLPQMVADEIEAVVPAATDLPGLLRGNAALRQAYRQAPACKGTHPLTAPAPSRSPSPTS